MSAQVLIAALLGAATVLGFAPFDGELVPVLTLSGLFALWLDATPRRAAYVGFAFGAGLFGVGASWVAIALGGFGGMPLVLAGLATAAFCLFLALYPALVGWISLRLASGRPGRALVLMAAAWALAEWLRSVVFTGFPWLSIGYAQTTGPLAGYAPIGGVFMVGFAVASTAALVVWCLRHASPLAAVKLALGAAVIAAIWSAGAVLRTHEWSEAAKAPIAVTLLQGNIEQDRKFDPEYRSQTLELYGDMVDQSEGRLVVLPESALPMFADEVPPQYYDRLRAAGRRNQGDVLVGVFFFEPRAPGEDEDRYYNSVVSFGTSAHQLYRKHHLVPFGETIPAKPLVGWLIRSVLHIPLADQVPGPKHPRPLEVAGERVAVNICYEDAFGDEIIRQLPAATLLVNMTNDAWYGRSLAAEQHNQMAAMRAVETARPMLRATNTGITSSIDHHGRERRRLGWFERGALEDTIAGRTGTTPYVYWGDSFIVSLVCAIVIAMSVQLGRAAESARGAGAGATAPQRPAR